LKELTNLSTLDLIGTRITEADVEGLKMALQKSCFVKTDDGPPF
jgi:hypothetical protein